MSTGVAGPMTTHPQLLPEGGHSSVGGHGILGSASSSLVGVSTLWYPSGLADPLDSSIASEGQITAESAITTATSTTSSSNEVVTSRQPPTIAAEVTAAAFSSPTHLQGGRPRTCHAFAFERRLAYCHAFVHERWPVYYHAFVCDLPSGNRKNPRNLYIQQILVTEGAPGPGAPLLDILMVPGGHKPPLYIYYSAFRNMSHQLKPMTDDPSSPSKKLVRETRTTNLVQFMHTRHTRISQEKHGV